MIRLFVFSFMLAPSFLFGQTATFYADSSDIWIDIEEDSEEMEELMEMEWTIRNQTIRFGMEPIEISIDSNRIDTLFYQWNKYSECDTIIFKITEPKNYKFTYNTCCGRFDVRNEELFRTTGTVQFIVEGRDERTFIGEVGDHRVTLTNGSETVVAEYLSPMPPNVYNLSLTEIDLRDKFVRSSKGDANENDNLDSKTISYKLDCLFVPLSEGPLKVIYNTTTNQLSIE